MGTHMNVPITDQLTLVNINRPTIPHLEFAGHPFRIQLLLAIVSGHPRNSRVVEWLPILKEFGELITTGSCL